MFYLSVRSKNQTLFEIYSRAGGLTLAEAWAAALPALLKCERESGCNQVLLRIDDRPVLDR